MTNFPDRLAMFAAAQRYCGNYDEFWNRAGGAQYRICRDAGLHAHYNLLEIGCGCLSAGFVLMQFVEPLRYCGLDPNKWLIDAALGYEPVEAIAARRGPRFLYNDRFDAKAFSTEFDFIFAHSVLSHAGLGILNAFLSGCCAVGSAQLKIVASFRGGEASHDGDWVYPDHSCLSVDDIAAAAKTHGLIATVRPEYTAILTAEAPSNIHDWVEFTRA